MEDLGEMRTSALEAGELQPLDAYKSGDPVAFERHGEFSGERTGDLCKWLLAITDMKVGQGGLSQEHATACMGRSVEAIRRLHDRALLLLSTSPENLSDG